MHEAFEMLPFAGQPGAAGEQEWLGEWTQEWSQEWQGEDEAEWEGERPRPGSARGGMRGGGLRARLPLRGQRRPAPPRLSSGSLQTSGRASATSPTPPGPRSPPPTRSGCARGRTRKSPAGCR